MSETDLQALERFVVENDDLLAIEEQIGRFNIFDALRIARVEIRHSNYLAWILTPGESHGQGDLFLKALLMDIFRKARQQGIAPPVSLIELDGADLQGVEIRREWRHIDMLIACKEPQFVIAIENKVDSGEHSNQLQRYENTVAEHFADAKRLFVYFTPEGEEASDPDWVTYSYADFHAAFSRTRKANSGAIGGDVAVFLEHYLSLIGNRFMENEDIDRLCRQVYANHRRALDLIWERVGNPASELVDRIKQWLTERSDQWVHITTKQREVEFIPVAWSKMLPAIGKRKTFAPERWLTVRLRARNTKLQLIVYVCPTTDSSIRRRTVERLLKDKAEFGFSTSYKILTDEWTRVFSEVVCTLPEDEELDVNAVIERVEKKLDQFTKQTAKLPAAMKELFPS